MKQLVDMDLQGAPLAYTPFCDNNKQMEGYRFWKQGFWKDHLRGRPYHIRCGAEHRCRHAVCTGVWILSTDWLGLRVCSALYVVDLEKLRKGAFGDQLCVIYDNLSRDPNSLANLDQDLPNYAQHQVRALGQGEWGLPTVCELHSDWC